MTEVNMNMFRAYDIRGIFGDDLSVDVMMRIGKAFGTYMRKRDITKITIGGDIRGSTEVLQFALLAGVTSTGVSCDLVKQSPLGITLFNSFHKKYGASAFITASHLPPEWNGVKFYWGEGIGFSPEENQEFADLFLSKDFVKVNAFEIGSVEVVEPYNDFVTYLKSKFNFNKAYKIAVDCGNGATSLVMPQLFKDLGFEVTTQYADPDPTFPNRPSEPNAETLKDLSKLVASGDFNFGAGFDGDGDRCVFSDEKGNIISPDAFGVIIGEYLLKTGDNNRILLNMECSIAMENYLKSIGGDVTRIKVGHSYLGLEAKTRDAIWGVEASGHALAPQVFLFDDALILPLMMASALDHYNQSVSEIVAQVTLPVKQRFDLKAADDIKFQKIDELTTYFKTQPGDTNDLDGVALTTEAGRILVRASNTSPKIRVTIESMTQEGFDSLKNQYLDEINAKLSA